jgi:small GTP-binding protein
MVQKKIVLLGTPGVGKTSLVRRFVDSIFDEKYLTTIGVKIDKKVVPAGGTEVTLMIWDIAGAEERFAVPTSYVRGAAGVMLVADGTRPETLTDALEILNEITRELGPLPFVLLLNKADLADAWQLDDRDADARGAAAVAVFRTSAKTGASVDDAFTRLATALTT